MRDGSGAGISARVSIRHFVLPVEAESLVGEPVGWPGPGGVTHPLCLWLGWHSS